MLDRASTFADPKIIELLQRHFVVVAIDQAYQRRQKDVEGDFFRKISAQSERRPGGTQQGLYVAGPDGALLGYSNHRSPRRIEKMLAAAMEKRLGSADQITETKRDARYNPSPPQGGLVVQVNAKVLSGYDAPKNDSEKFFQQAVSRDNLWISKKEHQSLVQGTIPESLQRRIARFHLVDSTRGEPSMWKDDEIVKVRMSVEGTKITGTAHMKTSQGDREFQCDLLGQLEVADGKVKRFDIVAKGGFRGEGRYTRRAPKGTFPVAVAFRLANPADVASQIPPQGSRGWVDGYIKP